MGLGAMELGLTAIISSSSPRHIHSHTNASGVGVRRAPMSHVVLGTREKLWLVLLLWE